MQTAQGSCTILGDLTDQSPVKIILEIDRAADPITGRLQRKDGPIAEFTGWLELTQALEAAMRDATGAGEERTE